MENQMADLIVTIGFSIMILAVIFCWCAWAIAKYIRDVSHAVDRLRGEFEYLRGLRR
jgi:uncharacterized membrane protein